MASSVMTATPRNLRGKGERGGPIAMRKVSRREVYYDVVDLERELRKRGVPTRDRPRTPDWLTPYEKEQNPCQSSFLKAVRAGVVDPPTSR